MGSAATTGHQNSRAAPRNSACSRSWARGFSSAASKSGEKCAPHITAAKAIHATAGKLMNRITREWRIGSTTRRRVSGEATRRSSVIGAASAISGAATRTSSRCWTMWTENSVVS